MKVKVYFHGHLRDKIKKDFIMIEAETAYDALKAIAVKYQKDLKAPLDIGRWKIKIKDYDSKESWFVPLFTSELHVYPLFRAAKSQWATIAIGATLMLLAGPVGGMFKASATMAAAAATAQTAMSSAVTSFMFNAGLAMVLSGVMNILFPVPTLNTSEEASTNSKYLNGSNANTAAAGTRIPFGYGLFKVSGHFISYNISTTTIRVINNKESS